MLVSARRLKPFPDPKMTDPQFTPFERDASWWFTLGHLELGPYGSKREASLDCAAVVAASQMIVAEIRDTAGGCFDELIGLPVSFVGPLIGFSTEQARRRLPVLQASERDSRVSLKDLRSFIKENTRQPNPLTRKGNARD